MPVSTISHNNVAYSNGRPSISANVSTRYRGAAQAYTGRTRTGYRCRAQQLQPRLDLVTSKKPLAVDCEGVILEEEVGASKRGLGRVSIVNSEGQAVYDTFVYYPEDVPHRPPPQRLKLGVMYNDIKPANGAQLISDVIKNVQALFDKAEIVVMHAASNDVQMLKGITWTKLTLYDTQTLPEYARLTSPDRPSLKFLTRMELGDEIQEGSDGHCSVEDARATMKLCLLQKSAFERDQSTLFTRSGAPVIAIKPPCPRYAPGDRVALPMIAELAEYGRKFNYRTSTWDYECEDPDYWVKRAAASSETYTPAPQPEWWSENTDWDAPRPTSPWRD